MTNKKKCAFCTGRENLKSIVIILLGVLWRFLFTFISTVIVATVGAATAMWFPTFFFCLATTFECTRTNDNVAFVCFLANVHINIRKIVFRCPNTPFDPFSVFPNDFTTSSERHQSKRKKQAFMQRFQISYNDSIFSALFNLSVSIAVISSSHFHDFVIPFFNKNNLKILSHKKIWQLQLCYSRRWWKLCLSKKKQLSGEQKPNVEQTREFAQW